MDVADDEFFSCRDESYDMDGEVLPEFRNEGASVTFVVETWNYDGWGCRWNERDEIRWDGAQFTYERIDPRPMNAYCLLSQANDAFEKGSYRQAANLFAQIDSSEFADTTSPSPNVAVEQLSQYIAARRALALAFDKNLSEARTVLGDIQPNGTMGRLVIQLRQASAFSDAWGMCDTIYHFFERINDTAWQENGYVDPFAWRPVSMTWGALDTVSGPGWDLPSPYSAGCKTIVDTRYAIARLRADQSVMPLQQLWRDFEQLRSSGHYSAALDMLGSIATDPNFNPASSAYVSYWRAVLLELSGHTDEAIADYLDLYNADPINAWGQLAILHLEWVPG